jgi:hypothetical protein
MIKRMVMMTETPQTTMLAVVASGAMGETFREAVVSDAQGATKIF